MTNPKLLFAPSLSIFHTVIQVFWSIFKLYISIPLLKTWCLHILLKINGTSLHWPQGPEVALTILSPSVWSSHIGYRFRASAFVDPSTCSVLPQHKLGSLPFLLPLFVQALLVRTFLNTLFKNAELHPGTLSSFLALYFYLKLTAMYVLLTYLSLSL